MEPETISRASKRVLILQGGVICIAVTVGGILAGWDAVRSVLLGGVSAFIPSLFVFWRIRRAIGSKPETFLRMFMTAETVKILLAAGLILLSIAIGVPNPLALFIGFGAVLLCGWLWPLLAK